MVHASSHLAHKVSPEANWLMEQEKNHNIHSIHAFADFQENVNRQKSDLVSLLQELKKSEKQKIKEKINLHIDQEGRFYLSIMKIQNRLKD